jgi:hypothetical protein
VIHVIEGNIPNVSENQPFATTLDSLPADETPSVEKRFGPEFAATHPLAVGPVGSPPHSVDGFVKEFLHELNTNGCGSVAFHRQRPVCRTRRTVPTT